MVWELYAVKLWPTSSGALEMQLGKANKTFANFYFQTWDLVYSARAGVTSNLKGNKIT